MDMASIKDVAKLAGVGLGTASRALTGKGYVAPETKKKIEEAARILRYRPNVLAQNLQKNKSGIIGILVPALNHCFFAELVQGLEEKLYRQGYKTMVCCTVSKEQGEQDYLDMLENNLVDGIITATHSFNDKAYLESKREIVSLDRDFGGKIPMVSSDHEAAGKMAAQAFKRAGCRKVLSLYGEDAKGGRISVETAHTVLREYLLTEGIQVEEVCTDRDRFDIPYYRKIAAWCLDNQKDTDGIFASDHLAVEFFMEGSKRGRKIPQDLKIISYDGTELTRSVYPEITSVVQNIDEIAENLIRLLLDKIEGKENVTGKVTKISWQKGGTC